MSKGLKNIFSVLAIVAISLSVFACAYTSMSRMAGMDMGGATDSATQTEHLDHAHSLTMAIMPTFILLVLACLLVVFIYVPFVLESSLVYLYSLTEISSPKERRLARHTSSPRAPPFS